MVNPSSQNGLANDTKIFILYSQDTNTGEEYDEPEELNIELGSLSIAKANILGVLLWTEGSVKRAWAGTASRAVNKLTCGSSGDLRKCNVHTLCPPEGLEPWQIMMDATTLLSLIQDSLALVEVAAWSFKTFGLEEAANERQ